MIERASFNPVAVAIGLAFFLMAAAVLWLLFDSDDPQDCNGEDDVMDFERPEV